MEKAFTAKDVLFSTTVLKVLDFLLQHPELELIDTEIAGRLMDVRKSAVNVALRKLAAIGFIKRTPRGNMTFKVRKEEDINCDDYAWFDHFDWKTARLPKRTLVRLGLSHGYLEGVKAEKLREYVKEHYA